MPFISRPAAERGRLLDPGLTGTAAFSHGNAFDRAWLGFHALRVLNRIELMPATRLPLARRANMEVLTLVQAGTYRAWSQAGDSGPVEAGGWHWLGAGAGVDVVEENLGTGSTLRLLQLWVQPTHSNTLPAQATARAGVGASAVAASANALLCWRAAACVRRALVAPGASLAVPATSGRACWIEVIDGEIAHGRRFLRGGDGLGVTDETGFALVSCYGADLLIIELPS